MKTASGATAVQVVWSSRRGSRQIEHLGSAHDEAELEARKAAVGSMSVLFDVAYQAFPRATCET